MKRLGGGGLEPKSAVVDRKPKASQMVLGSVTKEWKFNQLGQPRRLSLVRSGLCLRGNWMSNVPHP